MSSASVFRRLDVKSGLPVKLHSWTNIALPLKQAYLAFQLGFIAYDTDHNVFFFFYMWHEGPRQFISRHLRAYLLLSISVFIHIPIPIVLQSTHSSLSHNVSQTFQWNYFNLYSRKSNYNNFCMNVMHFCHWAFYSKVMLSYANCQAWGLVI